MLDLYWSSVTDGRPALVQHWIHASCLLGGPKHTHRRGATCMKSGFLGVVVIVFKAIKCWFNGGSVYERLATWSHEHKNIGYFP